MTQTFDTLPEPTIFCVGVYGSASTWTYNACRRMLSTQVAAERLLGIYSERPVSVGAADREHLPLHRDHWDAAVIKVHEGSDEAAWVLATSQARCVLTVRDPRDGIVSVMDRFRWSFDTALERVALSTHFAVRWLQQDHTLVLRYEDGFVHQPDTVEALAHHIGVSISGDAARQLFEDLSPARVRQRTTAMTAADDDVFRNTAGKLYNRLSHWHQGHLGDGKTGKWRHRLTRRQRNAAHDALWREINRLGYAGIEP